MAHWQVNITGKNIRKAGVEKLAVRLREEYGEGASISVKDATPPSSRGGRFAAAMTAVEDAKAEIESLKDELQDWYDNLPEAFQNGDKADEIQTAIDELEEISSALGDVEGREVEFPGMY